MNPTPNVIPQDSGSPTRQQPKRLRGTSERNFTAVVQLVCGFIAVTCGLVLVVLKTPYNDNYYGHQITRTGKTAFGIWGGLVFIASAIPNYFGRHRKSMLYFQVGLYFGFCLASAVIAVVGLGLSITAINSVAYTTSDTSICYDEALGIQRDQKYRCCIDEYRYRYDCRPSYNQRYYWYYSWYDYHLPTTYGYQRLNYNSPECESFRSYLRDSYKQCVQEQYYPCSFNQLMVNDSLNNTVIPPQVTMQQRGPTVISTTQVPQTFTPLQVPPQTGPLGY